MHFCNIGLNTEAKATYNAFDMFSENPTQTLSIGAGINLTEMLGINIGFSSTRNPSTGENISNEGSCGIRIGNTIIGYYNDTTETSVGIYFIVGADVTVETKK